MKIQYFPPEAIEENPRPPAFLDGFLAFTAVENSHQPLIFPLAYLTDVYLHSSPDFSFSLFSSVGGLEFFLQAPNEAAAVRWLKKLAKILKQRGTNIKINNEEKTKQKDEKEAGHSTSSNSSSLVDLSFSLRELENSLASDDQRRSNEQTGVRTFGSSAAFRASLAALASSSAPNRPSWDSRPKRPGLFH